MEQFEVGDLVLHTDTTIGKVICVVGRVTDVDTRHIGVRGFVAYPGRGTSEHDWLAYPEELKRITPEQYAEAQSLTAADREWIKGIVDSVVLV